MEPHVIWHQGSISLVKANDTVSSLYHLARATDTRRQAGNFHVHRRRLVLLPARRSHTLPSWTPETTELPAAEVPSPRYRPSSPHCRSRLATSRSGSGRKGMGPHSVGPQPRGKREQLAQAGGRHVGRRSARPKPLGRACESCRVQWLLLKCWGNSFL